VVEVEGVGWLPVKETSQDEVVDEPWQVWKTRQLMGKTAEEVCFQVCVKSLWLLWLKMQERLQFLALLVRLPIR